MERTASAIPRDPELTTGEPPLSEEEAARIRAVLGAGMAANTRRAYRGNWQAFEAWAASTERAALPASSAAVAAHLAELAQSVKLATLKLRRAAITAAHRAAGLADPCASEMVKRVLDGLKRDAAERGEDTPKRTAGLTQAGLAAVRATALARRTNKAGQPESANRARQRGLGDIALCGVMRDGLLRPSEAAALVWGDIETAEDGSGRLVQRREQGDREGAGSVLYLGSATMRDLAALRSERAKAEDRVFGISSAAQIARRIAAAAKAAGLGAGFSGESPRVGMAWDLAALETGLGELMQAERWKSAMPGHYKRNQAPEHGAVADYYAKRASSGHEPQP